MSRYEFGENERAVLEKLNIPMAIYQLLDKRVVTLLVTDGLCSLMGMKREDVVQLFDKDMYRDTHPDDKARVADAALKFASGGDKFDCVYRTMSHMLGDYVIIHSHGEHFFTNDGIMLSSTIYMLESIGQDIENPLTERLASNFKELMSKESLIRDNFYDTLTGLPNMSYFLQLADAGKAALYERGLTPGIVFFDLTGMKFFNEKYGLREGDNLIIAFGMILKKYFSNEDCGRMGQDHFAVFTEMEGIEDKLHAIFEDAKHANEGKTLPVHVGIYSMAFEDVTASSACDRAKIVSDKEKGAYVSKFAYYDENTHAVATHYEYVINNFERAMNEGWIQPYYQQLIRSVNGLVCDEEALARWIDPVKGLIPPDHFIYVLEDAKLIHKLDLYILECVLRDLEEVGEKNLPIVPVSINLSKYDFELCNIFEEIEKRVKASSISTDMITIEITESVSSLDGDFVATQIRRFHEAGFKVWMDDFGSGYSSLNTLQKFDFDLIKFDMKFMLEFGLSRKNHVILRELIQMTTKLGIDTVVEGVETIEQVKFLREIGCSKMQGYFFAKPIPLGEWYAIYGAKVGNKIEDYKENEYYTAVSKANLVEPLVNEDYNWQADEFFGQLPTGVLEFRDDDIYIMRYNRTFAEYMLKVNYVEEVDLGHELIKQKRMPAKEFIDAIRACSTYNKWEIVEGIVEQGFKLNLFIRKIGINPITRYEAFEVVIVALSNV
ncbi:diguanylate cyclase (GGDEF) domain-containing protein [Pseudobutyrivibrio sp. OR37]|uniref:EAL domain-containing protein n=1 Tax=Pseudobutyrivibrio sp. OR37 TaxID=1798186 RepID=UPI0008F33443|nr:EAL domain-containing protein [Pseudobutyrivibrio sp. OR37]SFH54017.1 diguanylate cyclase (GGDEF) domain-containing protein [Pseudobutyrivibrio sp. OR37]